jgi:hypothetical protein
MALHVYIVTMDTDDTGYYPCPEVVGVYRNRSAAEGHKADIVAEEGRWTVDDVDIIMHEVEYQNQYPTKG